GERSGAVPRLRSGPAGRRRHAVRGHGGPGRPPALLTHPPRPSIHPPIQPPTRREAIRPAGRPSNPPGGPPTRGEGHAILGAISLSRCPGCGIPALLAPRIGVRAEVAVSDASKRTSRH